MIAVFRSVRNLQSAKNTSTSTLTALNFALNYIILLRKTRLVWNFSGPVPSLALLHNKPTVCLLRLLFFSIDQTIITKLFKNIL